MIKDKNSNLDIKILKLFHLHPRYFFKNLLLALFFYILMNLRIKVLKLFKCKISSI